MTKLTNTYKITVRDLEGVPCIETRYTNRREALKEARAYRADHGTAYTVELEVTESFGRGFDAQVWRKYTKVIA